MPTQFPIRASDDELTPAAGSLSRAPLVPRLRPHHLGVSVPDLELAIDWYGRMLGFELESREAIKAIPASVAFLRREDFRIELFQVPGAESLPRDRQIPNLDLRTHGNKHLCFEVPDVPQTVNVLRSQGADIAYEVVVGGSHVAFIRDVCGNLIELIEPFSSNRTTQ